MGAVRHSGMSSLPERQRYDVPGTVDHSLIPTSQPHNYSEQSRPPRMSRPITTSIGFPDQQLHPAEDKYGNMLFDSVNNKIVYTYDWQHAFAQDEKGRLVCDDYNVPVRIRPGQLLFAYPASGHTLRYSYRFNAFSLEQDG